MTEERGAPMRTIPEKALPKADDTGKISVKSCQKIASRYLKPRVRSCHDFCKYGKRHDQCEEKPWKAGRRRVEKRPTMPNEGDFFLQVTVSGDDEKCKKNAMHKTLADKKIHSHDVKPSPVIKSSERKVNNALSDKKNVVKKKHAEDVSTYSRDAELSSLEKRSFSRHNAYSGEKTIPLLKKDVSFTKKSPSPNPPEIIKKELVVPSESVKALGKQYPWNENRTSTSIKRTGNISKDHSTPVKSVKSRSPKPPCSYSNSDCIHGKIKASGEFPKKSAKPRYSTSYPRVSLTKKASEKAKEGGSSKLLSPLRGLSNTHGGVGTDTFDDEKVSEKVLHVIKTEAVEVIPQHADDDHALADEESSSYLLLLGEEYDEKEYSDDEADELILNDSETVEIVNGEDIKEKSERKSSNYQRSSSEKLKFKSGRVVDIITSDDNAPRRLRFRKARTLEAGEDGESELKKITFKKAEYDASDAQLSSEKVVLRRQDVHGKKDAQGLLNNVIEETASKLVETRKSKVKALVGAFETVISLQETKPVN